MTALLLGAVELNNITYVYYYYYYYYYIAHSPIGQSRIN